MARNNGRHVLPLERSAASPLVVVAINNTSHATTIDIVIVITGSLL